MNAIRQAILGIAILSLTASTLMAQSTLEEWLALRQRKQARQALASSATVAGPLSITTIRFFSDGNGRLVGVGEVRNKSTRISRTPVSNSLFTMTAGR
jgi:hypothetical protein